MFSKNNCGNLFPLKGFFLALFLIFFSMLAFISAFAGVDKTVQKEAIGVDEKLGQQANLDFLFRDSQGDTVRLTDLVDRPTILNFVYFNCPGICTPLLNGFQEALDQIDLKPGEDFKILTISMNKDEGPQLAARKKNNYLMGLHRPIVAENWKWLTGDSVNINGITRSVGFNFKRSGDDFAHSAVLIVLSPEGEISRYLYGITFNPFDIKMAVYEASEGRFGPSIARVIQFCFSYDPEGRRYVFNILQVTASVIILTAISFVLFLTFYDRKTKKGDV